MPDTARLFHQAPAAAPLSQSSWSGTLHGEVAAMHRAIEQRLVSGPFDMAVIALPLRPLDTILARGSRMAGWVALAGGFAVAAAMIAALLA